MRSVVSASRCEVVSPHSSASSRVKAFCNVRSSTEPPASMRANSAPPPNNLRATVVSFRPAVSAYARARRINSDVLMPEICDISHERTRGKFPRARHAVKNVNIGMKTDPESIRARVQDLLAKSGKSKRAASTEAGLGETFLRDYLSGRARQLTPDKAASLSTVLPATAAYILLGTEGEPHLMGISELWPDISPEDRVNLLRLAESLAKKSESSKSKH